MFRILGLRSHRTELLGRSLTGCPQTLPVYCVPRTARRRGCLRVASTPEVPFCAAGWMAMAVWRVVRRPVGCAQSPGRGRSTAHTASAAECGSVSSVARRSPCILELHAPLLDTSGIRAWRVRWSGKARNGIEVTRASTAARRVVRSSSATRTSASSRWRTAQSLSQSVGL
jgi:hypothetical protein